MFKRRLASHMHGIPLTLMVTTVDHQSVIVVALYEMYWKCGQPVAYEPFPLQCLPYSCAGHDGCLDVVKLHDGLVAEYF